MKIELTKEQYENLLKVVYLGNWMINAIRSGNKGDERIEKYDDIEQYILSFAKDFELTDFVEYDEKLKQFFHTREFEELEDIEQLRENYDEDCFWDELFYKMSDKDFYREYSNEEILKMDMKERFEKEEPFRQKWDDEINNFGIERLEIKE